jgi:hypothetical protein
MSTLCSILLNYSGIGFRTKDHPELYCPKRHTSHILIILSKVYRRTAHPHRHKPSCNRYGKQNYVVHNSLRSNPFERSGLDLHLMYIADLEHSQKVFALHDHRDHQHSYSTMIKAGLSERHGSARPSSRGMVFHIASMSRLVLC